MGSLISWRNCNRQVGLVQTGLWIFFPLLDCKTTRWAEVGSGSAQNIQTMSKPAADQDALRRGGTRALHRPPVAACHCPPGTPASGRGLLRPARWSSTGTSRSSPLPAILIVPAASHSGSHQRDRCGHDGPRLATEPAGRRHAGRHPEPCSNRLTVPDTEEVTGSIPVPPTSSSRYNSPPARASARAAGGLRAVKVARQACSALASEEQLQLPQTGEFNCD